MHGSENTTERADVDGVPSGSLLMSLSLSSPSLSFSLLSSSLLSSHSGEGQPSVLEKKSD